VIKTAIQKLIKISLVYHTNQTKKDEKAKQNKTNEQINRIWS